MKEFLGKWDISNQNEWVPGRPESAQVPDYTSETRVLSVSC